MSEHDDAILEAKIRLVVLDELYNLEADRKARVNHLWNELEEFRETTSATMQDMLDGLREVTKQVEADLKKLEEERA